MPGPLTGSTATVVRRPVGQRVRSTNRGDRARRRSRSRAGSRPPPTPAARSIGFGNNQTGDERQLRPAHLHDERRSAGLRRLEQRRPRPSRRRTSTTTASGTTSSRRYDGRPRHGAYVDGQLIGTTTSSSAQAYTGYWRVGGDNLNGWNLDPWGSNSQGTTQPHSYYFNGTIADVAVYPTALSAAQVARTTRRRSTSSCDEGAARAGSSRRHPTALVCWEVRVPKSAAVQPTSGPPRRSTPAGRTWRWCCTGCSWRRVWKLTDQTHDSRWSALTGRWEREMRRRLQPTRLAVAGICVVVAAVFVAAVVVALGRRHAPGSPGRAGHPVAGSPARSGRLATGPLVPSAGALFGAWVEPTDGFTSRRRGDRHRRTGAATGAWLAIDQLYALWSAPMPLAIARWDLRRGSIPMISWAGASTRLITSGKYDAQIRARALQLRALHGPVMLRWFAEMDGTFYRAEAWHPKSFIAAWRHPQRLRQRRCDQCDLGLVPYRGQLQHGVRPEILSRQQFR